MLKLNYFAIEKTLKSTVPSWIERRQQCVSKIYLNAGIHAREWISPAVASYLMRELLKGNESQFLESFNFHILPVANPDGYEFSRQNDRLWRKTQSVRSGIPDCIGVDLNRNWDYKFNGDFLTHYLSNLIF